MKHPFDISRRGLLAAAAGALLLRAARALGENHNDPTTLAVGEEGGGSEPPATTQAVGEEGGGPRRPELPPPPATTAAEGEEGGNDFTTLAVGEEGGAVPKRFDASCFEDSAEIVMALVENPKTSRKLLRDNAKITGASKSYEGRGVTIYTIETKLPRGRKRTLTLKKTERDGNTSYSDAKFEET